MILGKFIHIHILWAQIPHYEMEITLVSLWRLLQRLNERSSKNKVSHMFNNYYLYYCHPVWFVICNPTSISPTNPPFTVLQPHWLPCSSLSTIHSSWLRESPWTFYSTACKVLSVQLPWFLTSSRALLYCSSKMRPPLITPHKIATHDYNSRTHLLCFTLLHSTYHI